MTQALLLLLSSLSMKAGIAGPIAVDATVCETGLNAFRTTIYPKQRAHCASCHGDGGFAIGHAVSNVENAYAVTKTLVDFGNVMTSQFVSKVNQRHWLNYDPDSTGMPSDDAIAHLRAWWETGESSCPPSYAYTSEALAMPANLPARENGRFQEIVWDLGRTQPSLQNCQLAVDVQTFTATVGDVPGSYRVKSPRVRCERETRFVGLRFPISSRTDAAENVYDTIDQWITPSRDYTNLSTKLMILYRRGAQDQVSVALKNFEVR